MRTAVSKGLFRAAVLVAALLGGCGGSTDLPIVNATQLNDKGPIFRSLTVTLSAPGGVEVEYWTGSAAHLRMTSATTDVASYEIPLPRLLANASYSYEVRTTQGGDRSPALATGSFQTADLPADVKEMTFAPTGAPTDPVMFLSVRSDFTGGVMIDANGQVVWYARTSIAPQGATRRANGDWVIELNGVGIAEYSALGEQVAFLPQSRLPPALQIHHCVTATPQNTLLFFAYEPRVFNGVSLNGESIWEWNPQDDSLVERWSAFDFFDPSVDFGSRSVPGDWFHANSIAMGQHGNIIVSFHFLDQIISISPDFSAIEWRLGGPGSTYALAPDQVTSGQHSAREIAPNDILVFDNGFARADGSQFSRALERVLDPATHTVTTAWQYRPNPDIWASIISSVRRLGNGNSVVTFGTSQGVAGATGPLAIHEVTQGDVPVWKVQITMVPGSTIFQGDPMTSIGGETTVP